MPSRVWGSAGRSVGTIPPITCYPTQYIQYTILVPKKQALFINNLYSLAADALFLTLFGSSIQSPLAGHM
jgi:hypothetical protein